MTTPLKTAPLDTAARAATSPAGNGYMLGKGHTLAVFSLLCLLMVFDFADRMIIASLLPLIKAEWHISDAQAGLLGSVLFVGMVLFAFPAVLMTNRLGRVRTASLMGIFWSFASAAGAFSTNLTYLATTRAAVGAGEAGYAPASYAWISTAFPQRRRQLALGIFSAGQVIGMAVGVALGGYLASHVGWRHALGWMALPGLIVAVLLYRGRDYRSLPANAGQGAVARDGGRFHGLKVILGTRSLLYTYLSQALSALQWAPLFYFLPTYFHRIHGIPLAKASYMSSGLLLLSIVAVPLGGWIMDGWHVRAPARKLVFAPVLALVATILYVIAFGLVDGYAVQYGLILLAFFIFGLGGVATLGMTQELVPPDIRPLSATCSVVMIHLLGSAPGPYLAGVLSDHFGLTTALLTVVVASSTLAVATLLLARRHYLGDLAKVAHCQLAPA
jgi:MFS family permease